MARIFYIKIDNLQTAYINGSKVFEEKVPGKMEECIFDS